MMFQLLILFLPWVLRRRLLCRRYGYVIHPTAKIGYSIILPRQLTMDRNSRIGNLTICKRIDKLELAERASIGPLNFITGFNTRMGDQFRHFSHCIGRRCELSVGRHSAVTSRHFLDCNGGITIGAFTTIAGIRSQFLTHSIDVYECRQDARPISIGDYCFVGTGVIMLPGSALPDYCILGGGSVVTKKLEERSVVYAGSPAKKVKSLNMDMVGYFKREVGFVV